MAAPSAPSLADAPAQLTSPTPILQLPVASMSPTSETDPLISPKDAQRPPVLDEKPLYAINFGDTSCSTAVIMPESHSLRMEWMEAKLALTRLSKPMYICAFVQLIAEVALLGPGLFNLVDWLIAALGAISSLLVLSSCCTLLETALLYAVLLNLLAIVLEFIPIGTFIADGATRESARKGVFGLFPSYTLSWRLALIFASCEVFVVLIRIASTICTWRYREAVTVISEYNEQQQQVEKRRLLSFKAVGDALQAMRPHAPDARAHAITLRYSSHEPDGKIANAHGK